MDPIKQKEINIETYTKKSIYNCGSTKRLKNSKQKYYSWKNQKDEIYSQDTSEEGKLSQFDVDVKKNNLYKDYEISNVFLDYISNSTDNFISLKQGIKILLKKRKNWINCELNMSIKLPVLYQEVKRNERKSEKEIIVKYPKFKKSDFFYLFKCKEPKKALVLFKNVKENIFNLNDIKYIDFKEKKLNPICFRVIKGKEFCNSIKYWHRNECDKYVDSKPEFIDYNKETEIFNKPIQSIIDFGRNRKVNSISVMGKKYDIIGYYEKMVLHKYVKENKKEWITGFKLSYRADKGKEWKEIGFFGGCVNRWTESIYEIEEIESRYLKVSVMSYNGSPKFQFGAYTRSKDCKLDIIENGESINYEVSLKKDIKYVNKWRKYKDAWDDYGKSYKIEGSKKRQNIRKNITLQKKEYYELNNS
jgi:hypothetical protein